ncbi:39S ribosomal protein L40, mitochondrial [Anthonomus grandis grandis]|uniref:39S ribosomal protein L40, mitochondrial n=1 Tax=Anthonomus grandis grandis TaxID=2921223 RepID=UPI0021652AD5|nr:39S ribosomal protein L40, mitochondrial [Anthonomus grandis grandis]
MSFAKIIPQFKRLCLQPNLGTALRQVSTNNSLFFKATPCLMAEPMKKKKRLDPAVIRAREERKKKKIEKQIRRLEKHARQLKPLSECEVPLVLLDEKLERQRNIVHTPETLEKRALLEKKWANYKRIQLLNDLQMIDRVQFYQQRALDELKKESEELYQEAIQPDYHMIPFTTVGPVETPAIEDYDVPDGEYQDVSKKWK